MIEAAPAEDFGRPPAGDQARVETTIALAAEDLFAFISNIERLFRLNPHLDIEQWRAAPDGFHLIAQNETNQCRVDTAARISIDRPKHRITIRYASGLKRRTTLEVFSDAGGARLIAVEDYPVVDDPGDPRVAEVDRSLAAWIGAIRLHLVRRARWGELPGWRWWHERFLPGLAPRQRRVVRLIVWVSVLEFAAFLFVALVFWLERRPG